MTMRANTKAKPKARAPKNRKKGWRQTDIKDVEDHLEDERLQERTGGLVAERPDEQLFFVDKSLEKDTETPGKRKKRENTLRCYKALDNISTVPAILKSTKGGIGVNSIETHLSRSKPEKVAVRQKQRREHLKRTLERRSQPEKAIVATFDLWADEKKAEPVDGGHFDRITKKTRVKAPPTIYRNPTLYDKVEAPHPGSSYNPAFDDHQMLIHEVAKKEIDDMLSEERLERKLRPKTETVDTDRDGTWMKEMSSGLGLAKEVESSEDEADLDLDKLSVNPPVSMSNMKTQTQRNKAKRQKEQLKEIAAKKAEKQREERFKLLKATKKQLNAAAKARQERLMARQAKRNMAAKDTQRLNKTRYEAPDADVALTSELRGSLRLATCSNTILEDRYKSMQKRNIIEPRVRAKHAKNFKSNTKYSTRRGHREITLNSKAGGGIIVPVKNLVGL